MKLKEIAPLLKGNIMVFSRERAADPTGKSPGVCFGKAKYMDDYYMNRDIISIESFKKLIYIEAT